MKNESHHAWRDRFRRALHLNDVPPRARRVIVGVIGGTVLVIGIALIVLPGPAVLVIPLGLAILATEFLWARRWLRRARGLFKKVKGKAARRRGPK